MKTVIKSLVIGLVVFTMSFSPALMGISLAGSINYEGFSSYKSNHSDGYEDGAARGVMFNFSFGGPEDYKKNSSIQEVFKKNMTTNQKVGFGLGMVGVFVLMLIMTDDDEACIEQGGLPIGDILGPSASSTVKSRECIVRPGEEE